MLTPILLLAIIGAGSRCLLFWPRYANISLCFRLQAFACCLYCRYSAPMPSHPGYHRSAHEINQWRFNARRIFDAAGFCHVLFTHVGYWLLLYLPTHVAWLQPRYYVPSALRHRHSIWIWYVDAAICYDITVIDIILSHCIIHGWWLTTTIMGIDGFELICY